MKKLAVWLMALTVTMGLQAQDFTATLTPDERRAAGLDKLDATELARLQALVERYKAGQVSVIEAEAARKVAAAEAKAKEVEERATEKGEGPSWLRALVTLQRVEKKGAVVEELTAQLAGTLRSFSGKRKFTLNNGQEWMMIEDSYYAGPPCVNPEVVIKPGAFGTFWLQIREAPLRVRVKPVKLE